MFTARSGTSYELRAHVYFKIPAIMVEFTSSTCTIAPRRGYAVSRKHEKTEKISLEVQLHSLQKRRTASTKFAKNPKAIVIA